MDIYSPLSDLDLGHFHSDDIVEEIARVTQVNHVLKKNR